MYKEENIYVENKTDLNIVHNLTFIILVIIPYIKYNKTFIVRFNEYTLFSFNDIPL